MDRPRKEILLMAGPLEGLRIVDLSTMLSGPYATDLLGDLGADVIKVEERAAGDHTRALQNRSGGMSSMFLNINRSKRSIAVDLKQAEGKQVVLDLYRTADVVVQNFRPGVVDRLGIGYEAAKAVKDDIIFLSISGFGQSGPYAGRRVYDPIIQALSGLTTLQAGSDDERPRLLRTILPDKVSAITASQTILAAIIARDRQGVGQHIQLSMIDSVLSFLWASDMGAYTFVDQEVQPAQAASFIDLIYQASDGYMTVSIMSNKEWEAFCHASDQTHLLTDERFATPAARDANVDARLQLIQDTVATRTVAEWVKIFDEFDVPNAPALTRAQVIADPQVDYNNTLIETDHRVAGRLRQTRPPAIFGVTPPGSPKGAPTLGEHSNEILRELGYSTSEIDALHQSNVVVDTNVGAPT
jgi:crotonobetainyl-CoA:carnitine CoA-transferase CaiB-like acyl-CoA transferase